MNWFRNTTRYVPCSAETFYGWEEGWIHEYVTNLSTVTSPTPGAQATMTLALTNHQNSRSFPRIGDVIMTKNKVICKIIDKDETVTTAHVLTIKPALAADAIGTIAASEAVSIISFAGAGGTGQPKSKISFPSKLTFYLQTFKESFTAEGNLIPLETWYKSYSEDGKNINGLWSYNLFNTEVNFDRQRGNAFLMGQEADNLTIGAAEAAQWTGNAGLGNPVYMTKGIYTWITEKGSTNSIPVTTTTMDDIDDIGLYERSQAVTSRIIQGWLGQKRINDFNSVLKTYIQGNGTDVTQGIVKRVYGDNNGFAVLGNYASYEGGGFTYLFESLDDLNDPRTLNAPGYAMDEEAIFFPISKIKDAKTNKVMPNVALYYQEGNGYSRKDERWIHGAAGGGYLYTGDIDIKSQEMRSVEGIGFYNANQGYIIK
jgi:hypothetical protein